MSGFDYSLLGRRVLCAVSGGADSMYLLHRCLEGAAENGFGVCAAHYNHCLRGEESERDEAFVRGECARLGVELRVGRGDVSGYAASHGMGTEEAARTLRYAFLEQAADELLADTIATAHNADDNAETVLFALARGSGPRGLAGIPPRRGRIVRPMLGVTRAEIERYLDSHGIAHVEDSTNASLDYSRNRIRALVMPVLRGINPGFAEAAQRSSALLRADEEYLDSLARDFLAKYPQGRVKASELAGAGWSVASRVVRMMAPRALELRHVEAVLALAKSGTGSADVPGARFSAGSGLIYVERGAPELAQTPLNIPGVTELPGAGLCITTEIAENVCEIHTSLNTFYFQYENILGTAFISPRAPGDRMRPVGRGCTKKLSDLMAERGIPPGERDRVPVLRDGRGVLAVPGIGQDERRLPEPGSRALIVRVRTHKNIETD